MLLVPVQCLDSTFLYLSFAQSFKILFKILKTFRHFKTQGEKLCNDDVNRASVLKQIIGENQSKGEDNLGYYIN